MPSSAPIRSASDRSVLFRPHYPVAIVGAGPTGLTLANLLGVYGVDTLLLERNAATVHEPRAVSIDDESLRTMQTAGLAGDVLKQTVAGYGSHYYSAAGRCFAKVQPTEQPFGYPRRNAFRQPVLERQLREGLGRFPQVTAAFGHALVSFQQSEGGVALRVTPPGGGEFEIACGYLVGCDGASSLVRRTLGIAMSGSSFNQRWLIVDLENSLAESPHTKVFCNPTRPCIALPGPQRTRRYEFKLHPHERDEDFLAPDAVLRLLETHEADPASRIVRTAVYTFHARLAEQWSRGRVFLAGDAAHLMPPFAGQGMNSGLRDANNLAWKLAAVVRGDLGRGLLASYQSERRDHAAAMIALALRIGRVLAPRNAWSAWLTENLFRLLDLVPKARDYIAQMKFKPAPRFAAGFLLPDGLSARRTPVGRLFPQPRVLTGDGRSMPLDDMLGGGFSMIARSRRPEIALATLDAPEWDRLGARRIALLPRGAGSPSGPAIVQELEDVPALAGFDDHMFLLRPDRYVAACLPLAQIKSGAAAVSALIAGTFER